MTSSLSLRVQSLVRLVDDEPVDTQPGLSDCTSTSENSRNALLIIAAFAVGQAIYVNNGVIHPAAIAWLALAIVSSTAAMLPMVHGRFRIVSNVPLTSLIVLFVAIQLFELAIDVLVRSEWLVMQFSFLLCAAGVALVLLQPKRIWQATGLIVLGHLAAGALTIQSTPRPGIDVWYFQQGSAEALSRGQDPYAVRFRDIYGVGSPYYAPDMAVNGWLTYSFPYPPLTLLFDLPGRMFGDVRWSHLVAMELAAVLIVAASTSPLSVLAAAMLLLTPRSLLVIQAAWTEPTVLMLFCLCVYCAARRPRLLWIAFGLLLGIKQYMVLAAPLLFILMPRRDAVRVLLKAAALAVCITAPFFIWNPTSFIRSVFLWQLRQPFRPDALSVAALIDHATGFRPGMWLCGLATCSAIILTFNKSPRGLSGFASSMFFTLLCFLATNKQAFCNYYFLVIGVGCSAIALSRSHMLTATAQDFSVTSANLPPRLAA